MDELIKSTRKFLAENEFDQYLTKRYLDYLIVAFSPLLGLYLKWEMQNVLMFSFVIWIILNPVSSQFFAKITLCFLVFVPLLLIGNRDDQAEQFAIFTFYFLVLTVVSAIIEFKKKQTIKIHSTGKKNEKAGD